MTRVLLIEDNPDDAYLLRDALSEARDESIELVHVEYLEQAAKLLSLGQFDVILLDLSLPDSQGIETVLRAQVHARSLPIVVLTGLDDDDTALRAVRAGAQDYLVKGDINPRMLVRSIRYASERKQAYEELSRLAQDLTRANKIKDDFLNIMSHELRTPLIAIVGYAQLLEADLCGRQVAEHGKAARVIREKSDELLKMIQTILEVVNIEAGRVSVVADTVSVEQFVADLSQAYPAFLKSNVTIKWECAARDSQIVTDAAKLRQVLQNLIDNAVKFTCEGHIVVSAREVKGTKSVEFIVRDTGIGIPSDVLPVIFDKFHQADSSANRSYEGMGLGLYVVKKLTELLHGTVTVQSELGTGSVFTLKLDNCRPNSTKQTVTQLTSERFL